MRITFLIVYLRLRWALWRKGGRWYECHGLLLFQIEDEGEGCRHADGNRRHALAPSMACEEIVRTFRRVMWLLIS